METSKFVAVAAWVGLQSLCACTLITDADDRKVVAGLTDLDFTFTEMGVHRSLPLDVAIVSEDDILQGRARVLLPPEATPYPEVRVRLQAALPPGEHRLFFFIDNNQNNKVDGEPNRIDEHLWIEDVPASGKGSFKHSINFNPFTESAYQSLNADVVFELPMVPTNAPRLRACLAKLLDDRIEDSLEVHVILAADQREVAYFKTFKGNPLPEEIRLSGVIDVPNEYRIDVIVDGEQKRSFNQEASTDDEQLLIQSSQWFPGSAMDILACRNMPAM